MKTKYKKIFARIFSLLGFVCMTNILVFGETLAMKEISNPYLYFVTTIVFLGLCAATGISFSNIINKINKW